MQRRFSLAFALFATLLVSQFALADNCEKGKVLLSEDFAGSALDKSWTTPKGTWQVENGVLKGVEKAEDHHAAVVRHAIEGHNLIGEFSFEFDGGKTLGYSLNNKNGHVCRVTITPTMVTLQKDRPNEKSPEKSAVIAKEKADLKPGDWHTMQVIVCGKEMSVTLDGKPLASGSNDAIDVDKTSLGFPIAGNGASIKQVRVWEAAPAGAAK